MLRPFNTYGPRQSERAVLPTMLRQLLAGPARDPPRPPRPAARPHVRRRHGRRVRPGRRRPRASTGGRSSSAPGRTETIGELFELARRLTRVRRDGGRRTRVAPPARRERGAGPAVRPGAARASSWAGRATTSLEDGLAATIDWLRGQPAPVSDADPRPALSRRSALTARAGSPSPSRPSAATRSATWTSACGRTSSRRSGRSSAGSRRRSRPRSARATPSPAPRGPPRSTWRCWSWTSAPGDEVLVPDAHVRRLGQPGPLRGGDAGVRRRRGRDLQPRPGAGRRGARPPRPGRASASRRRSRSSTCWATRPTSTPVLEAAERHGIPVVEDASEALGARVHGGSVRRAAGRHDRPGRLLQLQRQQAHHHRRRRDAGDRRRGARAAGAPPVDAGAPARARLRPRRGRLQLPADRTSRAALGLAQLEQLDELLAGRRANAAAYDAAIARPAGLRSRRRARPWADPSFWLYTAALATAGGRASERDELLAALDRAGIDARPIWTPAAPDPAVARRRADRRSASRTTSSSARSACPRRPASTTPPGAGSSRRSPGPWRRRVERRLRLSSRHESRYPRGRGRPRLRRPAAGHRVRGGRAARPGHRHLGRSRRAS